MNGQNNRTTEAFLKDSANALFERLSVKLQETLQMVQDTFQAELRRLVKTIVDEAIKINSEEKNALIESTVDRLEVEKREAVRKAVEDFVSSQQESVDSDE